jgi:hypothetical protein
MGEPGSPACAEHGDPLVCIACEQAENARPEWQPAGDPVGEPEPTREDYLAAVAGEPEPSEALALGQAWVSRVTTSDAPELSVMGAGEITTLCVQCGPDVNVDEDGCCVSCGCDAMPDPATLAKIRARLAPPPAPAAGDVELAREAGAKAVWGCSGGIRTFTADEIAEVVLAALRRVSPAAVEPHAVRQEPTWQPIETAPKDREVLVWKAESESAIVALRKDGRWVTAWAHDPIEGSEWFNVTHWMSLPPAPTAPMAGGEQ